VRDADAISPGSGEDWRPGADLAVLHLRAELLARIRRFFAEQDVMEVETPLLASTTSTDLHLSSLEVHCQIQGVDRLLFLQTSPEFFMKRLLAAGSGAIFQISKAFREGEVGQYHNPEFTLLEWYRPGFDCRALMDEIEILLGLLLDIGPAKRITYAEAFQRHANLDPFHTPLPQLREYTQRLGLRREDAACLDRETCLDLVLSQVVQPVLGTGPVFVTDFPAAQASMARLAIDDPLVADRFELFVDGIELANGYRELLDDQEQRARFLVDIDRRRQKHLAAIPVDDRLLKALRYGLPDCAGVALGFDRLVMLAVTAANLGQVMAFSCSRI